MRKWQEPCFGPDFGPFDPNLGRQIFYSKIWLRQSLDIMIRYHHVQYEKKLMIHNWETWWRTDGRMDGRADRRTDRRTRVISWGAFPLKSSVKEPRSEISFNFVRMKSNANRIYFMVGEISVRVSCKHPLK